MARELHRDLLAGLSSTVQGDGANRSALDDSHRRHEQLLREMSLEMAKLKKTVKELEGKLESAQQKVSELTRGTRGALEKLQGQQSRTEQLVKAALNELKTKVMSLATRFTEGKGTEVKLHELMGRHSQMLQHLDARVSAMQKSAHEQDLKRGLSSNTGPRP